jgi:hypothetical protein
VLYEVLATLLLTSRAFSQSLSLITNFLPWLFSVAEKSTGHLYSVLLDPLHSLIIIYLFIS